jgi:type I restriction enzyme S subunit
MKVNNATVLTGKVVYPTLPEQQKIANFLSLVDQRLAVAQVKIEALEKWKSSISNRLFTEINQYDKIKLGTISKMFSGGTPESTRRELYVGIIPFIKSGEISQTTTKYKISEEALNQSSAKMVKEGDLLYALYGATSGETSIAKISGAINQAVLCIRSDCDTQFLCQFLRYNKERIVTKYLQGGQGNLSAKIVKSIKVPNLEKSEQTRIATILTSIDARIAAAQKEVTGWENWKRGLLQKLLV